MPAAPAALPSVPRHDLNCGDTFPCPPEIQRRVDFWVMVFRKWNTNQVIFHDATRPERVYSVLQTKLTCQRTRRSTSLERERSRIKKELELVAGKLTQAAPQYTTEQKELLALFPARNAGEVKHAAANVRCQQGNRDRFLEALKRYEFYKDHVLKVLRDSGLSEDILYLPFVESAYNPRAYSRVGAAGLWQIMPRTARTLGLQLSSTIDERFDAEAATWAAARYLRRATDSLSKRAKELDPDAGPAQINPFVITSYNYGLAGMHRAMSQVGPDYIAVLEKYKSRSFRTAVRNFYSSFLAARYVARNAEKYFGDVRSTDKYKYSVIVLKRPTSVDRVSKVFKVNKGTLEELNPALTRNVWKGWRLIPDGYSLHLPYRADQWRKQVARLENMDPESPLTSGNKYVVVKGDTACRIAREFKVSCRDLIELNNLGRKALIRVGQKLEIPVSGSIRVAAAGQQKKQPAAPDSGAVQPKWKTSEETTSAVVTPKAARAEATPAVADIYKRMAENIDVGVRSGQRNGRAVFSIVVEPEETMGHYADWLGIGSTRPIRTLNGIDGAHQIRIGNSLILPFKTDPQIDAFEAKRAGYHRTLVDQFQQHYEILDVEEYIVKPGDSMWALAQRKQLPYWVLTRINPKAKSPAVGDRLLIPVTRARKPSKEPPETEGG